MRHGNENMMECNPAAIGTWSSRAGTSLRHPEACCLWLFHGLSMISSQLCRSSLHCPWRLLPDVSAQSQTQRVSSCRQLPFHQPLPAARSSHSRTHWDPAKTGMHKCQQLFGLQHDQFFHDIHKQSNINRRVMILDRIYYLLLSFSLSLFLCVSHLYLLIKHICI